MDKVETLRQKDIAEEIAKAKGISVSEARAQLDIVLQVIGDTIADHKRVTLIGFGTFQAREQGKGVRFSASRPLREALRY